jgi:murein DD-endopeptidase MepM/ murein hydrolase activator NlpD
VYSRALVRCAVAVCVALTVSACAGNRAFTPAPSNAGVPFLWPIESVSRVVTSGFGSTRGSGKNERFHKGIDLPAPRGTPVIASAPGIVLLTASEGAYGRYILIDHQNGYRTLYAHLHEFAVRQGDRVAAGQRIGLVGKSGTATGYHLHYEVHRNGQLVDPIAYVPH